MYQIIKIHNGIKTSLGFFPSLREAHLEIKNIIEKEKQNGYHVNKKIKTSKGLITGVYLSKRHKTTRKVLDNLIYKVYKLPENEQISYYYSSDELFCDLYPQKKDKHFTIALSEDELNYLQSLSKKFEIPATHLVKVALKLLYDNFRRY